MTMITRNPRGRLHTSPLAVASCLCAALLSSAAALASAQAAISGLWGSPLYRAEIAVAGSGISGTFTSLADPSAPAGTITGKIAGDGKGFAATWTQLIGRSNVTFTTWLRLSADGSVLNGYRLSDSGQPAAFSLHRAVGGRVPLPLGPDDLAKTVSASRVVEQQRTTAVTSAPDTGPPRNVTRASPRRFTFGTGAGSVMLAREYDRDHFAIRLALTWTQPGSILDTVGINAAAIGSWCVIVDADGHLTLQVYAPTHQSGARNASGWHLLVSPIRTKPGEEVDLTVTRTPKDWSLTVALGGGPRRTVSLPLPVPASGNPIYLGDFPGDNTFAPSYHPLRGFTGTAELASFVGKTR